MQYKTIVLELLQQHPRIYDQLLKNRTLLSTLEFHAGELRDSHLTWKELLEQARPGSDPSQIASEALEMALHELVSCLPAESPTNENEALFLEEVMASLRRTPPA